jgi:hypothetical protein
MSGVKDWHAQCHPFVRDDSQVFQPDVDLRVCLEFPIQHILASRSERTTEAGRAEQEFVSQTQGQSEASGERHAFGNQVDLRACTCQTLVGREC